MGSYLWPKHFTPMKFSSSQKEREQKAGKIQGQ